MGYGCGRSAIRDQARRLAKIALSLQQGGVGFYPRDQFVHLDTGRVRSW